MPQPNYKCNNQKISHKSQNNQTAHWKYLVRRIYIENAGLFTF